ncbi:hypothetical protein EWM62_06930 [Mucilaginibacter terrigena]|uniref:Glycosyltransferase RgtA/B/C/D-like domain-containing protein n=1 Tax=Mucilaginibacter terrigena TaxID=2492395 RepID=A0A4Q5LQF0_9SPHI|nr:hypothetical protein [Mucilaginibacter terrigena]RYU91665.1 hypothetical protein EWM62_06930 [Mucilaginibacter terrigena]
MQKSYTPIHRIILLTVFVVVTVLGVLTIITPSAIFPDASWGFLVMRSMQMGGAFNVLTKPDQQNIASNVSEFISWWSPGQYLLPHFFKTIFGLNTGQAAAVTTALCQIIGLAGFYSFFKKAGFTPLITALSLVVIICQQAFFTPYIFYTGGEILLFAFTGWFLYGCLVFTKANWKFALFVLLSGWIGFICKSSFIWIYAAGLLFTWVQISKGLSGIRAWVLKGFWVAIPAVASVVVIYILYLNKGVNPSSGSNGFDLSWKTLAFPIASPLLSGFSVDDLFNGLIFHNDDAILSPGWVMLVILLLAVLSVVLIYAIYRNAPNKSYQAILIIFYSVSILFFGSAYMRKLDISYEARHFRVMGLLIIPGLLHLFSHYKMVFRVALGLAIGGIMFFTIQFYLTGYYGLKNYTAYGTSGIGQQFIDQQSLNYIKLLDDRNKNATFVFFSPDIGLEIQHNRAIILPALSKDININFDEYLHKGHAGPLYILMPSHYIGIRASVILKSFPGYKGFSLKELSDDYVLYFATKAR